MIEPGPMKVPAWSFSVLWILFPRQNLQKNKQQNYSKDGSFLTWNFCSKSAKIFWKKNKNEKMTVIWSVSCATATLYRLISQEMLANNSNGMNMRLGLVTTEGSTPIEERVNSSSYFTEDCVPDIGGRPRNVVQFPFLIDIWCHSAQTPGNWNRCDTWHVLNGLCCIGACVVGKGKPHLVGMACDVQIE